MRRVSRDRGFLISLLFNMAFRVEWAVIGIVLLIVHHFFEKVPLWTGLVAFAVWFLISFLVTLLLSTANRLGNHKDPVRENKNPFRWEGRKTMFHPKMKDCVLVVTNTDLTKSENTRYVLFAAGKTIL